MKCIILICIIEELRLRYEVLFLCLKLMLKQLRLYSTSHCHLCELAQALVIQISSIDKVKLVDIAEDEALLAIYELRIPVLQRQDTKAELNWPFTSADIVEFLREQ